MMRSLLLVALLVITYPLQSVKADEIQDLADARAAYLQAWQAAPIHVVNERFVTRKAAYLGDVDARGSSSFAQREPIDIYLEVRGYDFQQRSRGVEFGIVMDVQLRNESGRVIYEQAEVETSRLQTEEEVFSLFVNFRLRLGGLEGPHKATLIVRDIVSGATTDVDMLFEIEG